MRPQLYCILALAMAVQPSFADRAAYGEARDIVARGVTITVRHRHDWSRIPITDDGWIQRFSPATPFGVDEDTSNLEFYSLQGTLVARTPSPPLTYLKVSGDDKYVIGLSKIKFLNDDQLVVFDSKGKLLLRRRISAHVYCFDARGYQDLKRKHPQAFSDMDRLAKHSSDSHGWREGDKVYLDINFRRNEPYWSALEEDLSPALCHSPLSANFGETVTNWVRWYSETDPQPRIVERQGRPFEVRLRDPEGIEIGIKFEPTPLESGKTVQ